MVAVYIVILCLSAGLMAWGGLRAQIRLAPVTGLRPIAGIAAVVPTLGFLIVVSAPAPMITGALALAAFLAIGGRHGVIVALVLALAACLIGLTGLPEQTHAMLAKAPRMALYGVAATWWLLITVSTGYMTPRMTPCCVSLLLSLAAVATAPLFSAEAYGVATDASIIASALIGLLLASRGLVAMGDISRAVLGFVLAYLQIAAFWHGAWISAAASMGIWLAAVAWSWMAADKWSVRHA